MRFKELLEYKRDVTNTNLGGQLVNVIARGVQQPLLGNTLDKLKEIIPGIEISSDRSEENLTQIKATVSTHINEILKFFEDADPTSNKQYTEWIVRRFIDGSIKYLQDVDSTVTENLARYHELKSRRMIPPELMDINKFKDSTGTNSMMRFFRDVYNIYKELPEQQAKMDKGEALRIYEDDEIRIIKPEDQNAACYYGQGTQWCTASTKSRNYFDEYNDDGPLYIILPKKPTRVGEKYQVHFESSSYMNENDVSVGLYGLIKRFPQLHELFYDEIMVFGGGTVLLATPENLENWEDIIENEVLPEIEKELESPASTYDWLGLEMHESVAREQLLNPSYTNDMKSLAEKKIEQINKIAKHISTNKRSLEIASDILKDLDEINKSMEDGAKATSKMLTLLLEVLPRVSTMGDDMGDIYAARQLKLRIANALYKSLMLKIDPYFNEVFGESPSFWNSSTRYASLDMSNFLDWNPNNN